jgi:hypothetical protein
MPFCRQFFRIALLSHGFSMVESGILGGAWSSFFSWRTLHAFSLYGRAEGACLLGLGVIDILPP